MQAMNLGVSVTGYITFNKPKTALEQAFYNNHKDIVNILLDYQEPELFNTTNLPEEIQDEILRRLEDKANEMNKEPIELAASASNLELVTLLNERKL